MKPPTRMLRRSLALIALLASTAALAGNSGVLIADIPHANNTPAVIAAVREAFLFRRWTIEEQDEISVTASLENSRTSARMRVSLKGRTLVYEEKSTRRMAASRAPANAFAESPQPIKLDRWLEYLRADVKAQLAGIPDAPSAPTVRSITDRLKVLDELRGAGAITEEEYKAKRAEILNDL